MTQLGLITAIELENFQSIRKRTRIDVRPLTFLYGPNSSGKSAIADAIDLFSSMLFEKEEIIREKIKRWIHRSTPKSEQSNTIYIAVEISEYNFYTDLGSRAADVIIEESPIADSRRPAKVELRINDNAGITEIKFHWDGKLILRGDLEESPLNQTKKLSINLLQNPSAFGEHFLHLIDQEEERFKSWLASVGVNAGDTVIQSYFSISDGYFSFGPLHYELSSEVYSTESKSFFEYYIELINALIYSYSSQLKQLTTIDASRGEIGASESFCTIGTLVHRDNSTPLAVPTIKSIDPATLFSSPNSFNSVLKNKYSPVYPVANSFVEKLALERAIGICHQNDSSAADGQSPNLRRALGNDGYLRDATDRSFLFEEINHALSNHLFLDNGYQIEFEHIELLGREAGDVPFDSSCESRMFAVVRVRLRNDQGQVLDFTDVGTGVSCVIPILQGAAGGSAFIQQPELHLHPALQSALMDSILEIRPQSGGPIVLETHSEHMMLRLLRRVRETSNGKHKIDPALAVTQNDISVYYFDPRGNGTTEVRRIRVSSLGEFIDRWPRGFFADRATDLFDE